MAPFEVTRDGVALRGEDSWPDPPAGTPTVVGLHGLTATRRYVVMGSRSLERSGHRVLLLDARGHGGSERARDPGDYGYATLAADVVAVLDARGVRRAALVGASMGAHTALAVALAHPGRVAALVVATPAYDPEAPRDSAGLARWDALSAGLRDGGVDGFLAAYGTPRVPKALRATVATVLRQRLSAHRHPAGVADALAAVPRSRPFAAWAQLAAVDVPALVVGDRDEVDPEHPLAVAERCAAALPGADLAVEAPGASPLAWQGGQLSRLVAEVAARADFA